MPVPYAKMDYPQSLNLYKFVGNNPLFNVDPDGHSLCGAYEGNIGACIADTASAHGDALTLYNGLQQEHQEQSQNSGLTSVLRSHAISRVETAYKYGSAVKDAWEYADTLTGEWKLAADWEAVEYQAIDLSNNGDSIEKEYGDLLYPLAVAEVEYHVVKAGVSVSDLEHHAYISPVERFLNILYKLPEGLFDSAKQREIDRRMHDVMGFSKTYLEHEARRENARQ